MERKKLEKDCDQYDSIYQRRRSSECASSVCRVVLVVARVGVEGKCASSMALVRPPGHHAIKNESNGFCFFNNVGIGATFALNHLAAKRILIIDSDVLYGQGLKKPLTGARHPLLFSPQELIGDLSAVHKRTRREWHWQL
ncbi:Hist deacetyl domain containing protein [Trichuris trichiura]|uniref:histone deacetylase n=1 Tax=Trichuris trichiura TaxID=36087 RepID=A0A077ZMQ9_TRITR|nr:Hist deacetyl domain containing protein [Trichuris trichiura]